MHIRHTSLPKKPSPYFYKRYCVPCISAPKDARRLIHRKRVAEILGGHPALREKAYQTRDTWLQHLQNRMKWE